MEIAANQSMSHVKQIDYDLVFSNYQSSMNVDMIHLPSMNEAPCLKYPHLESHEIKISTQAIKSQSQKNSLFVNLVFSLKLLLLLFDADLITGSTLMDSLISFLSTFSLAIGFDMNFDFMLLLVDLLSPRWKIDFHE